MRRANASAAPLQQRLCSATPLQCNASAGRVPERRWGGPVSRESRTCKRLKLIAAHGVRHHSSRPHGLDEVALHAPAQRLAPSHSLLAREPEELRT